MLRQSDARGHGAFHDVDGAHDVFMQQRFGVLTAGNGGRSQRRHDVYRVVANKFPRPPQGVLFDQQRPSGLSVPLHRLAVWLRHA